MSDARKVAWEMLTAAASQYVATGEAAAAQALSQAAKDWAAASGAASSRPASTGGLVFPNYGRSKGQPVAGASPGDLKFYAQGCRRTLEDPTKARWHDKERALLEAIEAEARAQGVEL